MAKLAGRKATGTFWAGWTPRKPGRYTWQARRTGCSRPDELFPPPIDCTSKALSASRSLTVRLPAKKLSVGARKRVWTGGSIRFAVNCAPGPCRLTVTASANGRRLGRVTRKIAEGTVKINPSRSADRWLAARLRRGSGGRVRVRLTAAGRDALGRKLPRRRGSALLVARKAPPPPPTPQQRAAARAESLAERQVRERVAYRYEIGLDRAYADCNRTRTGRYRCTWDTGSIHEPWDETCNYRGEADANRFGGYWDVRLYDIGRMCY